MSEFDVWTIRHQRSIAMQTERTYFNGLYYLTSLTLGFPILAPQPPVQNTPGFALQALTRPLWDT